MDLLHTTLTPSIIQYAEDELLRCFTLSDTYGFYSFLPGGLQGITIFTDEYCKTYSEYQRHLINSKSYILSVLAVWTRAAREYYRYGLNKKLNKGVLGNNGMLPKPNSFVEMLKEEGIGKPNTAREKNALENFSIILQSIPSGDPSLATVGLTRFIMCGR